MYKYGKGLPRDGEKAAYWYTKATELLTNDAEQGSVSAQHQLGRMYQYGLGVPQDHKKAAYWYSKAAEQGNADSQINLGAMYDNGQGVPQDAEKAVYWYTKAAEQGNVLAQTNLGVMYEKGQGVPQDGEKATYWYTKAAEQGDPYSQLRLAVMYYDGQGVPQDNEKAAYWNKKVAERRGVAPAQEELGTMYFFGFDVPKNYEKAAYWYTKAAEQGNASAQSSLGSMYKRGEGVLQDHGRAVYWYTKAAEQGYALAQFSLGEMYDKGQGVPKNGKKAAYWYTKAAEQGDRYAQVLAQCNLSWIYYEGKGVIEDYVESYKWALLAGKNGADVSRLKDLLRREMTPAQIAKAQSLAKQFVVKRKGESGSDKQAAIPGTKSYGTGFFVSSNGYVITAAHVVENTEQVKLMNRNMETSAHIVYKDEDLDIAVLKADETNSSFLPIISSSETHIGEKVFTLGFPQVTIQGSEVKYTEGSINALSGIRGNKRLFQISIPVQPGNSGGPLINSRGEVIGVITARLDDIAVLIKTGAIPQNVNYATKSSFVLPFLDNLDRFESEKKPTPDKQVELIEEVKKAVVLVICY